MEIKKVSVTIRDLCEGYINESETQIENAVMAYGGKLCVRPAFQRSFVYDKKQENAVIERKGKNYYVTVDGIIITVNASSYTIITAHKEKK